MRNGLPLDSQSGGVNRDGQAALAEPQGAAFDAEPTVQALLQARAAAPSLDLETAFDTALEAIGLHQQCAAWGDAPQRLANVDAMRSMGVAYAAACRARGEACTLTGLLYHLEAARAEGKDACAVLAHEDAVAIRTWHGAKGLEWPVVVLFGLEPEVERPARALGVFPEMAAAQIDLSAPLAGRWIRYCQTPYLGVNKHTRFYDRLVEDPLVAQAQAQREREKLRLLYVGWTRARDRLVLACHAPSDKLLGGTLALLRDAAGPLITMPTAGTVDWAGEACAILTRSLEALPASSLLPLPGWHYVQAGPRPHPETHLRPSHLAGQCRVVQALAIGKRLAIAGTPDIRALGEAMHAFLAADDPGYPTGERQQMAADLALAWGVEQALAPGDYLTASANLRGWVAARWAGSSWKTEVPVLQHGRDGSSFSGRIDLLVEVAAGYVIVDHKTFSGTEAQASAQAAHHAGQLLAYADAVTHATGRPVLGHYIHMPVLGEVYEIIYPNSRSA